MSQGERRARSGARVQVRPGTFAWWTVAVVMIAATLAIARDLSGRLEALAAVPVVVDLLPEGLAQGERWPPLEPVRCRQQAAEARPLALAIRAELEARVLRGVERAEAAEAEAQDLRLRNQLLRKFLDRVEGEAQKAAWQAEEAASQQQSRAGRGSERRPRVPIARTSTPRVQLIGSDALVTGTVSNPGPTDLGVRVDVELLLDGRTLSSRRLDLLLPAGGKAPFSQIFRTNLRDGTYSARVFVDI